MVMKLGVALLNLRQALYVWCACSGFYPLECTCLRKKTLLLNYSRQLTFKVKAKVGSVLF